MTRAKNPRAQPNKPTLSKLKRAHELWGKAPDDDWYAPIAELSRERGGDARIKPPHVVITCPWHDDTQPSCHVTPSRGLVKCFSCGAVAVEPVRLVAALRGKGVLDAATWLRKRLGLRGILTTEMAERLDAEAREAEMRDRVAGFCCEQLGQAFKIVADHGGFVCKGGEWSIAAEAEFPLTNAQLYWCRPALEWLVTRFGADDGTSEPLWPTACDHQLVGVLPPLATAHGHFGVDSNEYKFFSGYFGAQLSSGYQHVGWLVFPRHDAGGHVSSVKLRSPGEEKKFQVIMPAGEDVWPGVYGLRHARRSIGGTPARFFNRAWLMEGETSALATIAKQIRLGTDESLGWILLGGSGGSTPTLEPLADLGIERVSIVHDHDDAGEDVARQVIDKTRTPKLALEIFEWPDSFEVGTDPRDAVKQVGYPAWSRYLLDPAQFMSLPRWLSSKAIDEVAIDRVPEGDVKRRGQIAAEWGKLLIDPQEIVSFVTTSAAALGIDAGMLRRAIEDRNIVAAANDHPVLARHLLQDLCDGETEVVRADAAFWRYDRSSGIWRPMEQDEGGEPEMVRAIVEMCKDTIRLKDSTMARSTRTSCRASRPISRSAVSSLFTRLAVGGRTSRSATAATRARPTRWSCRSRRPASRRTSGRRSRSRLAYRWASPDDYPEQWLRAHGPHYGPQDGLRRQMRASDPTHVEKYFQLRVSLDAVPRGEVRAVLDAVVGAASTDVGRSIFAKRMLEFYEANKLSAFLDAVHLEIDRLQPAQVEAVIKAVADASETLAEPPLPERQMSTAAICTLRLAAKLPSSTANELLQRLVTTANRAYAVQVMLYSDASQHQSERLGFDFAALLGAFTVRIEREFLDESCDLFELYEYEWDSVLMLWRQPTRAAAYLVALLASTPQHWVSLASRALIRTAMSPTALSMEINFLREIISLQLVADAARDLDPHGFSPDDRALVALFREELLLVPQLVAELDSIATLAQELTKVSPNQIPAIDWSVRAWDRARPRLEPMLRSATWWSTLVSIYSSLTTMRAEFDAITPMSSPQEAVVALATAEAI